MKQLLLLPTLLFCYALTFSQSTTLQMTFDGVQRSFTVHLPNGFVNGENLPMVINMHGYTSNASQQEAYSKMSTTADINHFIVVYPEGIANAWNVGWVGAINNGANDVGFISKVMDTMINLYGVDVNRIYACGLSNGGFMSHRLACEISDRIAAIASVAGTFSDSMNTNCNPTRKVPVMQIHGTMDPTVPYAGYTGMLSVEATITKWVGMDQCSTVNDTINVANTSTTDNSTVQRINYRSCSDNTEVLLYKIIGGGHTWPNALIDIASYGNTNRDIDANTEIWNFFKRYSLAGRVGIDNVSNTDVDIKVYPNPASNVLNIKAGINIQSIALVNLLGETLLQANVNASETKLDIANVADGIYFLRMESASGVVTKKVIRH